LTAGSGLAPMRSDKRGQPVSPHHGVRQSEVATVAGIALPARGGRTALSQEVTPVTVFLTVRVSGG